jgi:serine/threonine protein kinase
VSQPAIRREGGGSSKARTELDVLSSWQRTAKMMTVGNHEEELEWEPLGERLRRRRLKQRLFGIDEGPVVLGRFTLLRELGAGTNGVVYEARDPELDRHVAVKVLRPEAREQRERLLREARSLARLAHPNVVTVYEVGSFEQGLYVAMELVEGQTMRQWLETPRSTREIVGVLAQAARGLGAAHDRDVVHRDFKPDNVLVGDDGRVRVLDFGLAGALEPLEPVIENDPTAIHLTRTGEMIGTPAYMAPEVFRGDSLDARADQFSLCVVAYEALTGERPFPGNDVRSIRAAVLAGNLPSGTAGLPRSLRSVISRGLSIDPAQRHRDMRSLIQHFESWSRSQRLGRVRWMLGTAAILGTIAGSVTLGTWVFGERGSSDEPEPESEARLGEERDETVAEEVDCVSFERTAEDPQRAATTLTMLHELMRATRPSDPEYPDLQLRAAQSLLVLARDREACDLLAAARSNQAAPEVQRAIVCRYAEFCGDEPSVDCGEGFAERRSACAQGSTQCCAMAAIEAQFHCLELRGHGGSADPDPCKDVLELLEHACRAGSPLACRGGIRWIGRSHAEDPEAVQRFHRVACEQGEPEACARTEPAKGDPN